MKIKTTLKMGRQTNGQKDRLIDRKADTGWGSYIS